MTAHVYCWPNLSSPSCSTRAMQTQKAYFLTKNIEEFSGEKSRAWLPLAEKEQDRWDSAAGPGGKTDTEKWNQNQMTVLIFQTDGSHDIPSFPSAWSGPSRILHKMCKKHKHCPMAQKTQTVKSDCAPTVEITIYIL